MDNKTENKILALMGELETILESEDEKTVEFYNYELIKKLQDSINYKLNELVQCDEKEPEE